MSIFRSTLKPYVRNTISWRGDLLKKRTDRPVEFQSYVSGKLPWARMVSFVDYNNSQALAKKYILYGGTLQDNQASNSSQDAFKLRAGIFTKGGAYGSMGNTEFGLRPMPGIESVTSRSMSAYGSLRETTIKYYAWDLQQLEDLNILFMKPGYPVLVEWGWSIYLENTKIIRSIDGINAFSSNVNKEQIYEEIKNLTEKNYGNYEANLGFIKNYSYTLLKNGGFECTTTLISMGDVINSIKINSGISEDTSAGTEVPSSETTDEFCILLSEIANGKVTNPKYNDVRKSFPVYNVGETTQVTSYSDLTKVVKLGTASADTKNLPGGDSRYTKFITFGFFIHLLNNYTSLFNIKGTKTSNFIKIELPFPSLASTNIGNGYCLSSPNALSINNDVCFIVNDSTTILRDANGNNLKFIPKAVYQETPNLNTLGSFYRSSTNLGSIGNIYINIGYLISTYSQQQIEGKGSVILGSFLKKILKDIEFTLGSINDFDIVSIEDKGIIIDKHYVEPVSDSAASGKAEISIMGLDTIVRDHKIMSKIFEEQSTLVAIAAQDIENVAALQTSTQVALNKNIYNRLYPSTYNKTTTNYETDNNAAVYKNTIKLAAFVTNYIIPGIRPTYTDTTLSALNTFLNQLLLIGEGATDYKAVVPITLELKMDGISGMTIGEIFRIKKGILPREYDNKSVGFIITRLGHEVVKSDWITSIEGQICLLDQREKYEFIKNKRNNFQSLFGALVDQNIINTQLAIHYYNALLSYVADFFNDTILILNANNIADASLVYDEPAKYLSRRNGKFRSYLSNYANSYDQISSNFVNIEVTLLTRAGFNSAYNINPFLTNQDLVSTPLLNYLNYSIVSDFSNYDPLTGANLSPTQNKRKENTIKYLTYVIQNSSYYIGMNDYPNIKNTFDELYNYIVFTFLDKNYDVATLKNAAIPIFGTSINNQTNFSKLANKTSDNSMEFNYINPLSTDQYGNINQTAAFLSDKVAIYFDGRYPIGVADQNIN